MNGSNSPTRPAIRFEPMWRIRSAKDKAPGIIVIHEIFGLTDWEPTVADKLAGAGYVAVVPDLLSPASELVLLIPIRDAS